MIYVNARSAIRTLHQAAADLNERQIAQATSRAMNETILQGRTVARKAVKDMYNIPQKNLAGINVYKAKPSSLIASLYASATPIPMDAFSPIFNTSSSSISVTRRGVQKVKGAKKGTQAGGGVSIEVIKGKREIVPFAFMIAGAKPRVFARGEYKRGMQFGFVRRMRRVNSQGNDTPIKPLISVTVHAAVINKHTLAEVEKRVRSVFPAILERNLAFISRGGT